MKEKYFVLFHIISIILTILLSCFKANSELSSTLERISKSEASGKNQLVTIGLSPGYGVNLSFPQEIIHKVWLDNPGIASLDSDGCLSGLGRSCQQGEGANVLHLRSIKPIKIPGLIPTSNSLLTVITSDSQGNNHNIYVFNIATKSTSSNIRTIEVVADNQLNPTKLKSILVAQKDFNIIHKGLITALNKKLIEKNSPLWERILNFSTKLRQGEDINKAANSAGISMELVERLKELGNDVSYKNGAGFYEETRNTQQINHLGFKLLN